MAENKKKSEANCIETIILIMAVSNNGLCEDVKMRLSA